jgi:CDP-diacylglycerol--serine O-phosphatidyltransferase
VNEDLYDSPRLKPGRRLGQYRGVVPGAFTMGNVICGFIAIMLAFEGDVTRACWFVALAALLDALDGKVARLSRAASQFGVELDSLADFLSFAVAPAVIVYTIKLSDLGRWGWIISLVYIMAGAYRLARYNIMAETEEKKDFMGLPVPVAAITLVAFIIFSYRIWGDLEYSELLVSMIILFAILMVSQVQYDTFPENFALRQARLKLIAIILAGVVVVFSPRLVLFPVCALYILYGIVRELYRLYHVGVGRVTGRPYVKQRHRKREGADHE